MVRRWGLSLQLPAAGADGDRCLSTAPSPGTVAAVAPAELQSCDLSAKRALALIRCAKEVARGRVNLSDPGDDRRLLAIPGIGPWTIACLALRGRGDPDALPAGDLGHVKLVGALAGLGRLAEVEEVERFYAPYAPFRGIAGDFLLADRGAAVHGPGNRARIRAAAGRAGARAA
jgi:3-methyladenine DNA glycosylase/8-oxoguanine DNA glycosylase